MDVTEGLNPPLIQQLPDEILLSVFFHLRKHYAWTSLAMLCSTLTVSQICSRWRGLALSTSALWSELVFRAADIRDLEMARRANDRMETCLLRSRTHLLHIHFDLIDPPCAISPPEIFNKFVPPNLWRCCLLDVVLPDHEAASAIFPFSCNLSRVKSFGVAIEKGVDEAEDDRIYKKPVKIGGLRGVVWSPSRFRINAMLPANFPNFDASNLEALYIADEEIRHTRILKILKRSINLQRLHLEVRDAKPLFQKPLAFPKLSFLSTLYDWPHKNFHATSIQKLFIVEPPLSKQSLLLDHSFEMPQLHHLTLYQITKTTNVPDVERITSMLSRFPQLITLELKYWAINWLLHFAVVSPIAPVAVDTEWLASHDPSVSMHIPPPGADDVDRRRQSLDVEVPESGAFLPNLRFLIISMQWMRRTDHPSRLDLSLALERTMRARPHLSIYFDGSFISKNSSDIEEGNALLREAMDLGNVEFSLRQVDSRIYSGLQGDIVV
ncbi:hypothetical protein DL93DRAFT_2169040 [Clavulina sp. PMI_390]|nr:hypothetical protein DL93DRAFT_2169040 [Clavulina sp. PMI_390]